MYTLDICFYSWSDLLFLMKLFVSLRDTNVLAWTANFCVNTLQIKPKISFSPFPNRMFSRFELQIHMIVQLYMYSS